MEEITATELKERLDRGDDLQIIDVREPNEYEVARLEGTKLIPLAPLQGRRAQRESYRGAARRGLRRSPAQSEGRHHRLVERS
jgi:rhodanese-related sulfurtransferase